jgi:hypothetical protein
MAKKTAKQASKTFHDIMKASVKGNTKRETFDKDQILNIESYLTSDDKEMRNLGSVMSSELSPGERNEMLNRLNMQGVIYKIVDNKIVRIGDE